MPPCILPFPLHSIGRDSNGNWLSHYRAGPNDSFDWRMDNKMRTVAAALCYCLNIGTDPPGLDGLSPYPTMECWIDPSALQPPQKSIELIGNTLQQQYARWQPKAKYELLLDPTSGAVKRMCVELRRVAKHERILFHYNGHGVPKPTTNGELWVFDKSYTLYVPLSIYDLLTWLGGPTILVLDCSAAGAVQENFAAFIKQKVDEQRTIAQQDPEKAQLLPDYSECILLGACTTAQSLPLSPATLPMDLFTSCLTTPLKIALKFFASTSVFGGGGGCGGGGLLVGSFDLCAAGEELVDKIPGKINDRKSPLGEFNWIYTAITDTIAWSILPPALFQKYFRQDLLLASLLRNYLLATRILSHYGCTTVSYPTLPNATLISKHPLWQSWDLCCEQYLLSLDKWLHYPPSMRVEGAPNCVKFPREHINFFSEHLLAFEVWLEMGVESVTPPLQLPILLQVLLSQSHRRRALILLARFIGKGRWAVRQSLEVGIFPYMLKLLSSPDLPLREVLVFIWSRLLAVDRSCQEDIIREKHESYFVNHLAAPNGSGAAAVNDRQRVMSGYVLATLCDGYPAGQKAVLRAGALGVAATLLESESPSLRKWMCLLLGKLWQGFEEGRALASSQGIPEKLCSVIADPVPEVRAAALFALGTFMSSGAANREDASPPHVPNKERVSQELMLAKNFSQLVVDASPLVREELGIALALLVESQKDEFIALAQERTGEEATTPSAASVGSSVSAGSMSVPPSPIHHALSPSLFAYPAPASASSGALMAGQTSSSSYVPASSLGSSVTSPALRGQPPSALALGRSATDQYHTQPTPAQGLAISLSPGLIAGGKGGTTPLSPLHLLGGGGVSSGVVGGVTPATPALTMRDHPVRPHPGHIATSGFTGTISPPTPASRNSMATPTGSIESQQYNQRLLLWRVIRTLSHDPFPTVSSVAVGVRKMISSRSALLSSPSPFGFPTIHSVQGSPMLQSNIGLLNTVPEQSLDGYMFADAPAGMRPSYDADGNSGHMHPHSATPARSGSSGGHARGRSDGSVTFDTIITRPRSRPVSEIEQPHHTQPPQHPTSMALPGSILGAMGGGSSLLGPGTSQHRASSPMTPRSSNPSPAQSPSHHAQLAPGQSSIRRQISGQRLTFDDIPATPTVPPAFFAPPPSTIFDRSAEYFIAPVGANAATEGMDADATLEKLLSTSWRNKRNADLILSATQIRHDCYDVQERGTFDQIGSLSTGFEQVSTLLFHPFENMIVVSDKRQIGVYDVKEFDRVTSFSNMNVRGSKISTTNWINEHHQSLLMVGSDEGVVRIWKNVHLSSPPEIVSAWLAVRSMPRGSGVGLVLDWQQETGHLLAAGPCDSIRVWDVEREICVLDLPVDGSSYVSSVCSIHSGSVVFAGCGDGAVRMFDLRADNHQIHTVSKHPGSVVTVRAQRWGAGQVTGNLVSGSVNGDVHVSDIRMMAGGATTANLHTTTAVSIPGFEKPVPLDALAVHDHAPIFAAGSRKQIVRIADFKSDKGTAGNTVSTLRFHRGFMGRRLDPVTTLAFHPHKLVLAVGAYGSDVPIFVAQPAAPH